MAADLNRDVEALVLKMFASADQRGQTAAGTFADCFAEQGQFIAGARSLNGRKDIKASREPSWTGIDSRTHTIRGIYKSTSLDNQYLLLGSLEIHPSGGLDILKMRFCSRLDVQRSGPNTVEIVRYEAFAETPSSSK